MHVGILSMQRVYNYGSFLQAYGLKSVLEQRGHEVFFLDIQNGPQEGSILTVNHSDGYRKYFNKYLFKRFLFKYRQKKLESIFDKNLKEILHIDNEKVYEKWCDAVVIGSDEVFSFNEANPWGLSMQLFGDVNCAPKVVSYAASCGYSTVEDVPTEWKKNLSKALNNLQGISVRDKNTFEFVCSFTSHDVRINLDPVLVYDFSEEVAKAEENLKLPQNYMIVYAYRNRISSADEISEIKRYAKKHGLKIICLGAFQYWADDFLIPTPFEALAYFKHATCVVTDTFHGTIMSAIFHRNLAVIIRDSNRNKLDDLVNRVGIRQHKIEDISSLEDILEINDTYSEFDSIISANRKSTQDYLKIIGI